MKKLGGIYGESYKQQNTDTADKARVLNERRDQSRQLKMVQVRLLEMKKENESLRRKLREAEQENRRLETKLKNRI